MFCNNCGANLPDGAEFCSNCGARLIVPSSPVQPETSAQPEQISSASTTPMMDIPIADAPDDAESDTTVLTADMSGTLTMDNAPKTNGFEDVKAPEPVAPVQAEENAPREHQPQVPEGKVVTPAPVTGSSILSDDRVVPAQAEPVAPQPSPSIEQPQAYNQPQANMFSPVSQPYVSQQTNAQSYNQAYNQNANVASNENYGGSIPEEYRPITPWGYLGYAILFNLPIIGLVLMFVWGFGSNTNKNLKNFARYYLITILLGVIVSIVFSIIAAVAGVALTDLVQGSDFILG